MTTTPPPWCGAEPTIFIPGEKTRERTTLSIRCPYCADPIELDVEFRVGRLIDDRAKIGAVAVMVQETHVCSAPTELPLDWFIQDEYHLRRVRPGLRLVGVHDS
jgi:hypothetical protein